MNDLDAYHPPDRTLLAFLGDEVDYSLSIPQCRYCVWYPPDGTCDAVPDGVPFDIYVDQVDHRQPYLGDHGIRWASLPDLELADE
jgi:hypothetical protein